MSINISREDIAKVAGSLGMGFYRVKENGEFLEADVKARELFGIPKDEADLAKYSIKALYIFPDERELNIENLKKSNGRSVSNILSLRVDGEERLLADQCWFDSAPGVATIFTGLVVSIAERGTPRDMTEFQRHSMALDKIPTGYYYIEYDENGEHRHHGHVAYCNKMFADILGVDDRNKLIGSDVTRFYAGPEEGEAYFRTLDEADEREEPLLNYRLKLRKNDGDVIIVAVDSHLIRMNGKIVGREGTIRDISERVALEEKFNDAKARLKRTTADINKLIHSFLHPVLKFSGNSQVFDDVGNVLFESLRRKIPSKVNLRKLAKIVGKKLSDVQKGLEGISGTSEKAAELLPFFRQTANAFEMRICNAKGSDILLDKEIRDTVLDILRELTRIGYFDKRHDPKKSRGVLIPGFVEYLQKILFSYLIRTAGILKGETQVMTREVDALRRYIGFGEVREYHFRELNLSEILEKNIEIFKPILRQKRVGVEFRVTGSLAVWISEHDIDRVVCNLFHNACKYCHEGPSRFVEVIARELPEEDSIEFSIKSSGIPILKDEIDSGKIFEFGFRSEMAYATSRDGTGVGLADAKEVVEKHGGKIKIICKPPSHDYDPHDYDAPYLTTVTVILPRQRDKKRRIKK